MNGYQSANGAGRQIVVFESIKDRYAGGVCIDTDLAKGSVIPAGTLLSERDPETGLSSIVKITPGVPAAGEVAATVTTFDKIPLGMLEKDTVVDANPLASVVTDGAYRVEALPDAEKATFRDISKALPNLRAVIV